MAPAKMHSYATTFLWKTSLKCIGTIKIMLFLSITKQKVKYLNLQIFKKITCLPAFCLQASQLASRPASQPAVRSGSTRCRALKITLNNGLLHLVYKTAILKKTIIPLHHGDSYALLLTLSFLPTGMRKQLMSQQNSRQGDNNSINMGLLLCTCH